MYMAGLSLGSQVPNAKAAEEQACGGWSAMRPNRGLSPTTHHPSIQISELPLGPSEGNCRTPWCHEVAPWVGSKVSRLCPNIRSLAWWAWASSQQTWSASSHGASSLASTSLKLPSCSTSSWLSPFRDADEGWSANGAWCCCVGSATALGNLPWAESGNKDLAISTGF